MSRPDHTSSCLLTDSFGRDMIDRQPLSVADHYEFRESLAAPSRNFDEIDDDCAASWPESNPASRRKDSEVNRLLSILDGLKTGEVSK